MKTIKIEIPGIPQSQKRHRTVRNGKFTKTYDPSSADKESFLWKAILDNKPNELISEQISIRIEFHMPRPKSHFGTGKNSNIIKPNAPKYHIKKPDIDNLEKFVLDSLNGIYWIDDAQIYHLEAEKMYFLIPKTIIYIRNGL